MIKISDCVDLESYYKIFTHNKLSEFLTSINAKEVLATHDTAWFELLDKYMFAYFLGGDSYNLEILEKDLRVRLALYENISEQDLKEKLLDMILVSKL